VEEVSTAMTAHAPIGADVLRRARSLAPALMLAAACGGSLTPATGNPGPSGTASTGGSSDGDTLGRGGASVSGGGGGGPAGTTGVTGPGGEGGAAGAGGAAGSVGPNCNGCTRTPIGVPVWEPIGAVMFVEPVGPGVDDRPFLEALLTPNHVWHPEVSAFGPGMAHAAPYSAEPAALVMSQQLSPSQFFNREVIASQSSSLGLMVAVVPRFGSGYGSSADFAKGPIMVPWIFPMRVSVAMDPPIFDPTFDATVPGYDAFVPPIQWDGPSHFLLNFRVNEGFAPTTTLAIGTFTLNVTIKDATGTGWTVSLVFTIGPDELP